MKKIILLLTCLLACVSVQARGIEGIDTLNNINAIKLDTSYVYAEATRKDAVEAQSDARAILELKLYDWLRNKHPDENIELLVTQSKEGWHDLLTLRGKYNRVFVYVSKQVVLPSLKTEEKNTEDPYSQQDKIAFIKRMYNDFFDNKDFDTQDLTVLLKYLTPEVAESLHGECPYDGCEGEKRYIVDFFVDGNPSFERPDYGYRVVTRSIRPLKYDWFEITNTWDVIDEPIRIGLKVKNTEGGLRVDSYFFEEDEFVEELLNVDSTIKDWELLITPEEQKMISMVSFYEIEPYIKQLKAADRINGYGKYSTMPKDDLCHLFIYDKEGKIVAVLLKTHRNTYNLKTQEKDAISNYKNCGAIWFTLNGR